MKISEKKKSSFSLHTASLSLEESEPAVHKSFYSYPVMYVGSGSCGLVAGSGKTLVAVKEYIAEKNIKAEVIETGCIGMCGNEPIFDIQMPGKQRISFGKVTAQKVEQILDHVLNHTISPENVIGQYAEDNLQYWDDVPLIGDLPFFKFQHRLVLKNCGIINPLSIEDYIKAGGYRSLARVLKKIPGEKVCEIIEESGLRGRGGGGYPTGRKWATTLNSPEEEKYLICNGDESDPGAFMDRSIIEGDPHKLIEGIIIASYAIRARRAYVYLRASNRTAVGRIRHAIEQAKEAGFLGEDILGSGYSLNVHVREGGGAFVCGEETALIASIEGKRGTPRPKPPYPAARGLFGKPTVINNVETLANVPVIIEKGASWYSSIGTASSKGTKVFSLSGKIRNTGTVEVNMGITLRELIYTIGGGIRGGKKLKAIQIGGPSGSCIPEEGLEQIIDYESLQQAGTIMGSGGIVVMDEDTCMVDMVKFFADFLQNESCGKCIPCREGTRRIHEILQNITVRPKNEQGYETLERFKGVMQLEKLATVIKDTSLCGLGQTAPNPLLSAMKHFRAEFEEHIFDRFCRAGVCKDLKVYAIDVEKCSGCTVCAKKCPAGAIIGSSHIPHFIIEDKCTGCGICFDVCKFVAITVK